MNSALYFGKVRHQRFAPKAHSFTYHLLFFYLDLSEVDGIFRLPFLFSQKGPSVLAFRRKDYLGDPSQSLRASVSQVIERQFNKTPQGPIRMLTQLSYFGFCFNPITLYYCFDAQDQRVEFIVADVTNTPWHERHAYAVECAAGQPLDFKVQKKFHVSPFMPMELSYRWRLSPPSETLSAHMENHEAGRAAAMFDATLSLKRAPLTLLEIFKGLIKFPLLTIKAYPAIYWQALLLIFKRLRFYPHPSQGGEM